LFVNCTDLIALKIYFITDKSRQVNNKNIDNLNEISPMIISYLNKLESFSLADFPIKNNKLKDLIESLKLSKIKKLALINCFQKKDNLTPLVQYLSAPNTSVTEIDLSNHTFGILNTLNNTLLNYDVNKKLTSINFTNCKLTDEDINYISNYIVASPNLLCCDISKNTLSTKACSQFGYCVPKSTSLETIKLCECGINPESLLFLFNAKGSKCLKNLILNGNDFGDIGLVSVSAFIKSSPLLENVEVKKCKGTDMGFITLVNSIRILPNSKLKFVNYQENNITQIALGILKGSNEIFKNKGITFKLNRIEGESEVGIDCAVFG
jgi:Ran GTPase-activating protein (RanGAP) involved in mRNA processing and transport